MCIVKSKQDEKNKFSHQKMPKFFFKVLFNLAPQLLPPMESLENYDLSRKGDHVNSKQPLKRSTVWH